MLCFNYNRVLKGCALLICLLFFTGCDGARVNSGDAVSLHIPSASQAAQTNNPVDFVVVQKKDRLMALWKEGRLVKTYPILAYGAQPVGHKVMEGDERTPEGLYTIDTKHPSKQFQKFLRISYPNATDKQTADRLNVSPGGNVGIHGDRGGWDGFKQRFNKKWTDGCIAVRNSDIEEIYEIVAVGTPILIKP